MLTINNTLDGYLKDIEIKGNTIQDADNLADIRSVGEKVEGQELYEIPVLSRGKNLFKEFKQDSVSGYNYFDEKTNTYVSSKRTSVDSFYAIIPVFGKSCYINFEKEGDVEFTYKYSDVLPNNFTEAFSRENAVSVGYRNNTNNSKYLIVAFRTSTNDIICKIRNMQIEEGTVTTEYEPYQEDKLTILSPTQLEKVGDVADRIVCKDGVWGVEKNVGTIKISEWSDIAKGNSSSDGLATYHIRNIKGLVTGSLTDIINTKLPVSTSQGNERMYKLSNANEVVCQVNSDIDTIDKFKEYMKGNLFKYIINSTFIPLPHSQQIKLRTFANKTNISFLTEIEGTIKAQVPKSLGATVNTHTTQIDNLNKELDRVKKLEESTVSTVETESDFTVVEATSGGYFEDVKLEGKTLVNLGYKVTNIEGTIENNGNLTLYFKTDDGGMLNLIKPSTIYTLVFFNLVEGVSSCYLCGTNSSINGNVALVKTPDVLKKEYVHFYGNKRNSTLDDFKNMNFIILEGDHTQNPPSYFEGLKSVGDDTDEIVVSSVNENLCEFIEVGGTIGVQGDTFGNNFSNKTYFRSNYINVSLLDKISYTFSHNDKTLYNPLWCFYDSNKKGIYPYKHGTTTSVPSSAKYVRFEGRLKDVTDTTPYINDIEFAVYKGDTLKPYTPHQTDKKQLLFYNTETQTWEKPVLREWDSIEKHSDGKYYYHQRSREVVLNGTEVWVTQTITEDNTCLSFYKNDIVTKAKTLITVICDKISSNRTTITGVGENIYISATGRINVNILKSKLTTSQDVQGFKQWLQENNVTVVYQLEEEKVYECTNIDLITYANETNYIVESGAISPKSTLKVHNNISNVVSLLQKKVSLLESNITNYMITQNRLQLASTYSADSVTFKVDYYAMYNNEAEEYNNDLYDLILNNILVGKDNYNYDKMFNIILDYASWNQISWEQFDILVGLMDIQHNPPIEELPTEDEIEEDIIEEEAPVE